jgi:ribosomal protein RSM22 (predicted rRNA methylase)
MDPYAHDLARWMPRLVAVWRRARKLPEGPSTLAPSEVKEVAAGVRTLSLGLTRERQLAGGRYMDDPQLLGAYLLFYWPVSYAQGRQVLGELGQRARSVLDLGSGPGPLSFAALDGGSAEVTAADRSRAALALARELAAEAGEALATREWDPHRAGDLPASGVDAVLFGHLLNELFGKGEPALGRRAALVERALAALRPGGSVVIIEPALRDTSRELLQLRDVLVRRGFAVRAPCLWRGDCPALVKPSDWCHAERGWTMPPLLEQLARAAGLRKESLKMSYLVLAPPGEPWAGAPPGRTFRIVSEPLEGKGRQRFMGCGPDGRMGLALQEKHRTEANEAFFHLQRGDVVSVSETEPRGDGLALGARSEVRVIAPAGRAVPRTVS